VPALFHAIRHRAPGWVYALLLLLMALGLTPTRPRRVAWQRSLVLPPGLMLLLFAGKFGVGVALGMHPGWRSETGFMPAVSTSHSAFSGVFLGRAMALWALARNTARLPD
jgi:hypothetical protein